MKFKFAKDFSQNKQQVLEAIKAGAISPYVRVPWATLYLVDDLSGEEKYLFEESDCELPVQLEKAITLICNGKISTENLIETSIPYKEYGDIPYEFWKVGLSELSYDSLLIVENPLKDSVLVEYDKDTMTIYTPDNQLFDLYGPRKEIIFKILNDERPVRSIELKPFLDQISTAKDAAYVSAQFQGRYSALVSNPEKGIYSKGEVFKDFKIIFKSR
ncbi:MAG: hypothetical protein HOO06_07560 [Bdellovibrionaceae bacterium]|nr:hypothetical protein [Pseudobdellovibrionaceae bacterium]